MRFHQHSGIFCTIPFLLLSLSLFANEFNYQPYLIGDRSSGMGGTGIADAYASDAAYINPGGLARARHDSVSFMATLYGFRRYQVDSAYSTGEDFTSETFEIIPASAGSIITLAPDTVASLSMFVTEQRSVSEIQVHSDKQHYFNYSADDKTLWMGPGIGHRLTAHTMIGAGAYVTYRDSSRYDSYYLNDYKTAIDYNRKFYDYGLLGMFGIQQTFSSNWHGGLVFQTPNTSLHGSATIQSHVVSGDPDYPASDLTYANDLDVNNRIPAKVGAGLAYRIKKNRSCALDLTYHFPASYDLISGNEEKNIDPTHVERKHVLDVNLGAEYYFGKIYPLRLGFFTSFSSAPDPEVANEENELQADVPKIDMYGLSCSFGKETEKLAFNLGINYVFGSGEAIGWATTDDNRLHQVVTDASESHLYVFFTTSYLL